MSPRCNTRSGAYRCIKDAGHSGDCETDDVERKVLAPPAQVCFVGPYKTPGRAHAYALGAVHYATGLGLDRLAKDMGCGRTKTESDYDLAKRLALALGVTQP